jgi:hypothetical protein
MQPMSAFPESGHYGGPNTVEIRVRLRPEAVVEGIDIYPVLMEILDLSLTTPIDGNPRKLAKLMGLPP